MVRRDNGFFHMECQPTDAEVNGLPNFEIERSRPDNEKESIYNYVGSSSTDECLTCFSDCPDADKVDLKSEEDTEKFVKADVDEDEMLENPIDITEDGTTNVGVSVDCNSSTLATAAVEKYFEDSTEITYDMDICHVCEDLFDIRKIHRSWSSFAKKLETREMKLNRLSKRLTEMEVSPALYGTYEGLLIDRIAKRDLKAVRVLLAQGVTVENVVTHDGRSIFDLLLVSAIEGYDDWNRVPSRIQRRVWRLLLWLLISLYSCDNTKRFAYRQRLLFVVCRHNGLQILTSKLLSQTISARIYAALKQKSDPSQVTDAFSTTTIDTLLLDVNARDPATGDSPLHEAFGNGCLTAAKALLSWGADVNVTNREGDTPLHSLARCCPDNWKCFIEMLSPAELPNGSVDNHTPSLDGVFMNGLFNPCIVNHFGELPEMLAANENLRSRLRDITCEFRQQEAMRKQSYLNFNIQPYDENVLKLPILPILSDWSHCRETGGSIPVWNFVDRCLPQYYKEAYATDIIYAQDIKEVPFSPILKGCNCEEFQSLSSDHETGHRPHRTCCYPYSEEANLCECVKSNITRNLYYYWNENQMVLNMRKLKARLPQTSENSVLYECHDSCRCPNDCGNRVFGNNRKMRYALEIFRYRGCGSTSHRRKKEIVSSTRPQILSVAYWGVRTCEKISEGALIVPYLGELAADAVGSLSSKATSYNLLTENYANIACVIRTHKTTWNCAIVMVYSSHHNSFPVPCVFAAKSINAGEELVLRHFFQDKTWEEEDDASEKWKLKPKNVYSGKKQT